MQEVGALCDDGIPCMPVGEAVDGVTGDIVVTSCPDVYEHGGVYVMTALLMNGVPSPF